MRQKILAAAVLVLTFLPARADAGVSVKFVGADRYSDAEAGSSGSRAETLNALRQYFSTLGARYLRQGQDLAIEVLDIDLAGERLPRGYSNTRVVTGTTPPRINLRYTLRERGRVVRRHEETLSNLSFLMGSAARSGDRFAYEKDVLANWFRTRIAPGRRSRS